MKLLDIIDKWYPRSMNARTFILPKLCIDTICDFLWGDLDTDDFYDYLESNTDVCIDHQYTNIPLNNILSDFYKNKNVYYFTFVGENLIVLYDFNEVKDTHANKVSKEDIKKLDNTDSSDCHHICTMCDNFICDDVDHLVGHCNKLGITRRARDICIHEEEMS